MITHRKSRMILINIGIVTAGVIVGAVFGRILASAFLFLNLATLDYFSACTVLKSGNLLSLLIPYFVDSQCKIEPEYLHRGYEVFKLLGALIGAAYFAYVTKALRENYLYLRNIKLTWFETEKFHLQYLINVNNRYLDILWSVIYTFTVCVITPVTSFLISAFVYLFLSTFFWRFIALIAGCITYTRWVYPFLAFVADDFLYPEVPYVQEEGRF